MSFMNRTIVALDNMSRLDAEEIIEKHGSNVYGFKVNHTLFPNVLISPNMNVFVDYKMYDIPNTMCSIVEHLIGHGVSMVTVNMNNNSVAIEALEKYSDKIKLLGVTALTSWCPEDAQFVHRKSIEQMYNRSIMMMEQSNFWGMICAATDLQIPSIQKTNLKKICPGIRAIDATKTDQLRTAPADKAIEDGADLLVMGRSFFWAQY